MSVRPSDSEMSWRPEIWIRVLWLLVALGMGVAVLSVRSVVTGVLELAVCAFLLSGSFLEVRLDSEQLTVRGYFWRVARIQLADVTSVSATNYGLRIARRGKRPVMAAALQKWNVQFWLKLDVPADAAARTIMRAADQASRSGGESDGPHARGVRFARVRFRESYDIEQVDDFFDSIDRATTDQAHSVIFDITRLHTGYDMEQVDEALDAWERRSHRSPDETQ